MNRRGTTFHIPRGTNQQEPRKKRSDTGKNSKSKESIYGTTPAMEV